ncbi:MAG TPA: methyltransferase domain-containing protein [Rubrobacter sp.]|nr:methyltransferase domain-containing protein [Rubrobacter sp.]
MKARDFVPYREDRQRTDQTGYLDRLVPSASEHVHDRLVGYGFARRYVGGKTVADICLEELGPGSRLLAETAGSVAGMAPSSEAVEDALKSCPAPNVSYERSDISDLPYAEEHFDVVVALGMIEARTEDLVREARRVLKPEGVLVVSVPDKQFPGAAHRPGMYVSELRELLGRHFGHVRTYRQGAVAGGIVLPTSGNAGGALVESIALPPNDPRPEEGPPTTRFILAVCSDAEIPEQAEGAYLLLDRDRRIFDEVEDLAEDVELLRDEIENMQRTEVQAFRDSLRLRQSEISYLRARIRHSEAKILRQEAKSRSLEEHIQRLESSRTWRIFEPYRKLRSRFAARRQPPPEGEGGSEDHQPG